MPAPRTASTPRPLRRRAAIILPVPPPFRLDLTTTVLQRLPTHPVEVRADDRYVRVFRARSGPAGWVVRQRPGPPGTAAALDVAFHGAIGEDLGPWVDRLWRALGLEVDLAPFHRRAARLPALAPLARAMRGLRPPRFQALHEAFASVIPFQQVSLASAVATLRRLVVALEDPAALDGVVAWPFPTADAIAGAPARLLRAAGLSEPKVRALQGACRAIVEGRLDEAELDRLPTPALLERLREVPGIGPWSAAVLALRGFGRLDVFPPGDAAAVKHLADVGGGDALLERLGRWRGMLYYALFLRRRLIPSEGSVGRVTPTEPDGR